MAKLLSAAWLVVRVAWRTGPLAFLITLGEVLSTVLRFLQPLFVGLIVDGLVTRSVGEIAWGAGLFAVALGLGGGLEAFAVGYRVKLIEDVGFAFDRQVVEALSRIESLDVLEDPKLSGAISNVKGRADTMGYCFNGLMSVAIQAAAPVTSMCVALVIDPRLLILVAAGVPTILVSLHVAKLQDAADELSRPFASRTDEWAQLLASDGARAERRIFKLWSWYRDQFVANVRKRDDPFVRPARLESLNGFLAEMFYLASVAAILAWILTTSSGASPGAVAATLLVALDLKGTLSALRFALSRFGPSLRAAMALQQVRRAADNVREPDPPEAGGLPGRLSVTEASYTYPTAEAEALSGVSVEIEPGQVVAVVGANGAGKSTLVEMLLGLRTPRIGRANPSHGRRSLVAQHFGRFEFAVAEAVGMRDLAALSDEKALASVRRSLEAASTKRFWEKWPNDLSHQLGASWPGGSELSGGQWQAIAAARCFNVGETDLVILDEPTAALDPEAQEEVTRRYLRAARNVARGGGIAVLVTHRMSIPRLADRIIVLSDGRIVEDGNHEELVAVGGTYAQAFETQASGFLEFPGDPWGSNGDPGS